MKELTGSLAQITPVITEIKSAYDNYNQAVDCNGHDSCDDESVLDPTAAAPPEKEVQDTPKDARDELLDKFPTPGNCTRLEVVRVHPEKFNSVRKEIKTEDVMLQKAQKPILKGITAVTRLLDDYMKAEKGQKPLPTMEAVMKILSDSISLLCDASHEIDLRRRTLFEGDMKTEYRLLCSDQNQSDCIVI